MGSVSWKVQLYPHLPTRLLEHKPDALFHQFAPPVKDTTEETILPPSCVVRAARWEIEQMIQEAQQDHPVPQGCPEGCLFVPPPVRSLVLQGDIPPSWPAILALTKWSPCCGNVFGGHPWLLTPESLSPPVLSVTAVNPYIKLQPTSSTLCPYLIALGLI